LCELVHCWQLSAWIAADHAEVRSFEWVVAAGGKHGQIRPLSDSALQLPSELALVVTGDALYAAVEADPAVWSVVGESRVFARMKPQGKATVIRRQMQEQGCHVLKCGDCGNEGGTRKQADVGVAFAPAMLPLLHPLHLQAASAKICVDFIRQGRCTPLSALQLQ